MWDEMESSARGLRASNLKHPRRRGWIDPLFGEGGGERENQGRPKRHRGLA